MHHLIVTYTDVNNYFLAEYSPTNILIEFNNLAN